MRGSFLGIALLGLGLAPALPAQGEPAPPAEAWSPVRVFIGSWTGTGADKEKVTRQVASSTDNRRLVVLERAGDEVASWGEIAYDASRHNLVLQPREGGPELVLQTFEAPAPTPSRLVFASSEEGKQAARVTYEFAGWNEFVERLEERGADGRFTVTRETRFKRGNSKLALKTPAGAGERTAGR